MARAARITHVGRQKFRLQRWKTGSGTQLEHGDGSRRTHPSLPRRIIVTVSIETSESEGIAPTSKPVIDAELPNIGPRVTPADIEKEIVAEYYFTAKDGALMHVRNNKEFENLPPALGLLTFCVLVLRNGFTVTGESAVAAPENFDAAIGRRIARENAIDKIWPLLGFRLRDTLAKR
jgi:hypothetical protein